jgi:L-ascorbate metabolism protein UlaG (beta-lactamase superfamily)
MTRVCLTHLGAATVLLEVGGLRILTDPALDPAGGRYGLGWGFRSTKLAGPALSAEQIGRLDAVLLSHDQHADNLDEAGRTLLRRAPVVITTSPGARRLAGGAIGLSPWQATELVSPEGLRIVVTATPARHGPPLSRPFVGAVTGFVLGWEGQAHGVLYLSGDTVWFRGLRAIGRRYDVGTALLHLGGVRFRATGPVRFTLDGRGAARLARAIDPRTIVPVHYEGWSHFRETREQSMRSLAEAGLGERVRWLPLGEPVALEV